MNCLAVQFTELVSGFWVGLLFMHQSGHKSFDGQEKGCCICGVKVAPNSPAKSPHIRLSNQASLTSLCGYRVLLR